MYRCESRITFLLLLLLLRRRRCHSKKLTPKNFFTMLRWAEWRSMIFSFLPGNPHRVYFGVYLTLRYLFAQRTLDSFDICPFVIASSIPPCLAIATFHFVVHGLHSKTLHLTGVRCEMSPSRPRVKLRAVISRKSISFLALCNRRAIAEQSLNTASRKVSFCCLHGPHSSVSIM